MSTTKTFCVHVFERKHFESVEATDAREAEKLVLDANYPNGYDAIADVEVMRECACGTDNEPGERVCDNCGEAL